MNMDIKAVISDMDGVLLNTEEIYHEADRFGVVEILGCVHDHTLYPSQLMGHSTEHYFKGLRAAFNHVAIPTDLEWKMWEYCKNLLERDLKIIDGAVDFFKGLDVPFALASNGPMRDIQARLIKTKVYDLFQERIFSGCDVARKKPFPDLFLYAANQMNVAPENCLVIEDSIPGVIAATSAGMRVAGFCGGGHCYDGYAEILKQQGADIIVHSYSELTMKLAA